MKRFSILFLSLVFSFPFLFACKKKPPSPPPFPLSLIVVKEGDIRAGEKELKVGFPFPRNSTGEGGIGSRLDLYLSLGDLYLQFFGPFRFQDRGEKSMEGKKGWNIQIFTGTFLYSGSPDFPGWFLLPGGEVKVTDAVLFGKINPETLYLCFCKGGGTIQFGKNSYSVPSTQEGHTAFFFSSGGVEKSTALYHGERDIFLLKQGVLTARNLYEKGEQK